MFIITLNRKQIRLYVILALTLVLFLAIVIYINSNFGGIGNYEAIACNASLDNSNFIAFLASSATTLKNVELFDIAKGEVVKTSPVTPGIRILATSYLDGVKSLYVKVNAFPEKGFIVKIPLTPPVKANKSLFTDYGIDSITEVFVIFPEIEQPYLLILDKKYNPFFYNFEGDTENLKLLIGAKEIID